ncbi:hypothetical protein [Citrobacter amalonaticus]|uniref:hypothetical protein n=1 Tax=Citrobacter amalonaticus TaxID=35703 RepID=UPI001A28C01B|nr:hypothetical protein [Citrobacter amalonaticus]EKW2925472.1 hypothetical protein [Citrobacter amalonaticus]MDL4619978.1 hypothetical protein [Citrobacter amalonaticus]MDL4624076.1 hypothetical protein [Citrobacter amalonaticus]HAT3924168.1 hypothetical protein [Citrobacter amalonaticus]
MKVYFISDDTYFLQGAESIVSGMANMCSETIQVTKPQFIKYFDDNDVIFLAINSGMVKEFILNNQTIKKCHLILIYNHPITFSAHGAYPWVIPKNITCSDLVRVIHRVKMAPPVKREIVRRKVFEVFDRLCHGWSNDEIATRLNMGPKYVNYIKRCSYLRYGLTNCNAAATLVCRDICLLKEII